MGLAAFTQFGNPDLTVTLLSNARMPAFPTIISGVPECCACPEYFVCCADYRIKAYGHRAAGDVIEGFNL
jgi:hypothetical protein